MPVLLSQSLLDSADPSGAVTASLVAFHPAEGERLVFSWSDGVANGPGISRTGIDPPFMRTVWSPTDPQGRTDDAEEMRTGSFYIDEDCLKVERELSMDPPSLAQAPYTGPCGPPPSAALRALFRRRTLHADRKVHTVRVRERYPNVELVGQVGCGDTTMNPVHVACVQDSAGKLTFLYLDGEPIHDRQYPCLVAWRGRPQMPVTFEEAVTFNPGPYPGIWIAGLECSADIDFAVSGKPVLSSAGTPIPLHQITHFFADLRHLFALPKLTPPPHTGSPVVMFGKEITRDLWLGEKQLLDDVNLQRAAWRGPVLLDRLYGGLSVTRSYLDDVLKADGYRTATGSVEWQPGDFRIDQHGTGFEIYFREAVYPWNIIAVGQYRNGTPRSDQPVILSCVFGGISGRTHFTLREAVQKILDAAKAAGIDLKGAVLLDEGGDVFQKVDYEAKGLRATPLDPLPPNGRLACQRRLVRCCFFLVRGEHDAI